MSDKDRHSDRKGGTLAKERQKTQRPRLYKVVFHNDDFSTMEFVVHVLESFFDKNRTEATRIMLLVHHTGVGIAGAYTHDTAETRVKAATDYAQEQEMPLLITMEPE